MKPIAEENLLLSWLLHLSFTMLWGHFREQEQQLLLCLSEHSVLKEGYLSALLLELVSFCQHLLILLFVTNDLLL